MAEAVATLSTMDRLVKWAAGTVVSGGILWVAWATMAISDTRANVAVLRERDGTNARTIERVDQLERNFAAVLAARDQFLGDNSRRISALEGQVEAQRRDIQDLGQAIAALTAELKARK